MSDRFGSSLGTAHGEIHIAADLSGVKEAARALVEFERKSAGVGDGIEAGFAKGGKAADTFGAKLKRNQQGIDDFALKAGAMGLAIGVGLAFAVDAASDTEEAISKVGVVFGDQAEAIEAFAEGSAEALGLSRREALKLTGTLGNLFVSMGLGQDEAAGMSTELVTLAADLASFNNVAGGAPEVLEALRSGLVGESEPLRQFGIIINETVVAEEALRLGLAETKEELTEQDKVMARYSLILEQTATAQGDFARTSEGLANQTRIARAQLDDAAASLGAVFLPIAADAAAVVASLAEGFNALSPGTQEAVAKIAAAAAALAIVLAVGAKVVSIGITTAAVWGRVAAAFAGTAVSADVAAASMTATGVAAQTANTRAGLLLTTLGRLAGLAALAIVIPLEVQFAGDAYEAITEGGSPGLFQKAEDLGLWIGHTVADAASSVGIDSSGWVDSAEANAVRRDIENALKGEGFHLDPALVVESAEDVRIEELDISVQELIDTSEQWGLSIIATAKKLLLEKEAVEATNEALDHQAHGETLLQRAQREGVDVLDDLNSENEELVETLEEQAAAAIESRREQDALNEEIQKRENIAFLAEPAQAGLRLPFTRDALDIRDATTQFNADLDSMTQATLDTLAGVTDLSSELPGVQAGFSAVGASAVEMALDLANADQLHLTASQRQALGLVAFLGDVDKSLAKVEGTIAENADDLSMWSGRIGLVSDTLGLNSEELNRWLGMLERGEVTQQQFNDAVATGALGPLTELDALLASGAITQQEYNEAKQAGIFLIQRSAGALQDERVEQVKLLDDLAKYVQLHDAGAAAVNNMTAEQKGFVAALESDEGALALQQLQLLAYLVQIDQIEPEVVTAFIADASAADPVVRALFESMGLIPPEVTTTLTVEDEATPDAEMIRDQLVEQAATPITFEPQLDALAFQESLDDLDGRVTAFVSLDGTTVSITVATEAEALAFAAANAEALDGREVLVHIRGTGAEEVHTTLAEIQGWSGDVITVPIDAQVSAEDRALLEPRTGTWMPGGIVIPVDLQVSDADRALLAGGGAAAAADALGAPGTARTTVVVDDEQARADVDSFVAYADLAFAEHHLLVLGVEDELAITTLRDFQAALGAYSDIPVPPRVLTVSDDQALRDLAAFQLALGAYSAIPVPPHVLTVDDTQAALDLAAFAASIATLELAAEVTVTADADDALLELAAVAAALVAIPVTAAQAATDLQDAFTGIAETIRGQGSEVGWAFVSGMANAISDGANIIYAMAYAIALNAYWGARNALEERSLSKKAIEVGNFFTAGLVRGLAEEEAKVTRQSERLADAVVGGFAPVAESLAVRSVLGGDRTAAPAAGAGAAVAGGVAVGTINVPITVTGSSDPEATARLVWQQANEAIGRALSGGVS